MSSGELPAGAPTTPSAPASDDVIHDIGFRHYDGVRFGRGWIVRSLLVETVRGIFGLGRPAKSKIMPWVLFGILLLPPLIIARLRAAGAQVADAGGSQSFTVELSDETVLDAVQRAVADLGVGLIRMQRRRHHLTEFFQPEQEAADAQQ